jgi:hypothetical protein
MLATVLVGPGKPKLVQIQRPPSSTSRSSHARSSRADTPTEKVDTSPSTPVQPKNEVSAFSPYDTPCQRTYGTITTMMHLANSFESVQSLRPAPLSITPHNTHHRFDSAVCVRSDKGDNPTESQASLPAYTSSAIWPVPRRSQRSTSDTNTKLATRKLESALDQIMSAIDAFPSSLLHLDSPMVRQLRNTGVKSHDYVAPLQKIFPAASPLLLSPLAAWCLVDAYLSSVERKEMEGVGLQQYQYQDVSNESLHQIPAKARRMLGIRSPEQAGREAMERGLRQRARFMRISVGVIAQRLMEAVRGGWVEELWGACGVLVNMVDMGGSLEEGAEGEEDEEEEGWV